MENNTARLAELRAEVKKRADIIGCPFDQVLTYEDVKDSEGTSYTEVDTNDYHQITLFRGEEIDCFTTASLDEFLERMFVARTQSMAKDYELKNRIEGQDSRRQWFKVHLELLNKLSPAWAIREAEKQEELLKTHPFKDK